MALPGKIARITGSSRGIGRRIMRTVAQEEARVAEPSCQTEPAAQAPEEERLVDRVTPPRLEQHLGKQADDRASTTQRRVAWRVWRDPRVRPAPRILMIAALVYLVLPLHVVPQRYGPLRAGVLRSIQTLLVLAALRWLIVRLLLREVRRDQRETVAESAHSPAPAIPET
jgi:NAD(P)-dependent dehydrogenase (short-subunit alcohol dehydrogenase family)